MNIEQTSAVLGKIKLGDNREVDAKGLVLREWHDTIGHLDFEDAIAAVTMHRRETTAYLLPAHIVANVRRIREERAERIGIMSFGGTDWAPKPENFDALCRASKDPVKWAAQVAIYNAQLRAGGYPEVHA